MGARVERRDFVTSAIAMAGAALSGVEGRAQAQTSQEYYLLRKYSLRNGAQTGLTQAYFAQALIPALNRMSITPVGAFKLDIGPETPTYFLLIPATSAETLVTLDDRLARDGEFTKAAAPFLNAPATAPAYERVEASLLSAFHGWPKLTAPKSAKRIFQ